MTQPQPPPPSASEAKTVKAARTRARILDAALALVEEVGYDKATMRAIATRAGVAPSNAYYYFRSKEELIQGFYARLHEEHMVVLGPALESAKGLREQLLAVVDTKLDVAEPYHASSAALYRAAADPKSPLNPFSEASRPVRDDAIAVFTDLLAGTRTKIPADLARQLPRLLWTWELAIILRWIHDDSEGRRKTRFLAERTADLIVKLIRVSTLPGLGPLRRSAVKLVAELFEEDAAAS